MDSSDIVHRIRDRAVTIAAACTAYENGFVDEAEFVSVVGGNYAHFLPLCADFRAAVKRERKRATPRA